MGTCSLPVALNEPLAFRASLQSTVHSEVVNGFKLRFGVALGLLCGQFSVAAGLSTCSCRLVDLAGYRIPDRSQLGGRGERRAAYYAAACPDTRRVPGTRIASRGFRDNEMLDDSDVFLKKHA